MGFPPTVFRNLLLSCYFSIVLSVTFLLHCSSFFNNSNVNSQVERIKVRKEKFLEMAKSTDTAMNTEFKELRKGRSHLLEWIVVFYILQYKWLWLAI